MSDFGPLAAQYDPNILDYFHITTQIKTLFTSPNKPNNFIFVARPGGGKTALVNWLESGKHGHSVISIRADKVRFEIENDESPTPEDYRLLVSVELFTGLISEIKSWPVLSDELQNNCEEYFRKTWWKSVGKFFNTKFEGLSIMGNGFSLKADERSKYLREIRKDQKVRKASDLLKKIATEVKIIVVIDDPEFIVGQGLEIVTKDNSIRLGSFIAALNLLHSLGVQVIVFLKEHILQAVQENFRDFAHFEDRIEGLEWTSIDLLELIQLRLQKRLYKKWEKVFDLTPNDFCDTLFPNLINGPRDLLFICNTSSNQDNMISKKSLQKSVETLQRRKWGDIATQYNSQWPKIDIFSKRVTAILKAEYGVRPITKNQFIETIKSEFSLPNTPLHDLRKQEAWINTALWGSPSIEERLFLIGVLGYVYQKEKYYPWAGRSLEKFRLADKIFLSPLFVD